MACQAQGAASRDFAGAAVAGAGEADEEGVGHFVEEGVNDCPSALGREGLGGVGSLDSDDVFVVCSGGRPFGLAG